MKDELRTRLEPYGQEHLLRFWDELDPSQRQSLAEQIGEIDFALIDRLFRQRDVHEDLGGALDRATSPPAFGLGEGNDRFTPDEARARGREALADGRVGVILVAGGQGTRLGFPHPKGMYPIGPVSGNSLFQIHLEKILAAARRWGKPIPLYLMTSPATHQETVEFLGEHDRFGLAEEDLTVFCQGTMPAVDAATGKVLLAGKGQIATSPDGHGGMLGALARSGALDEINRRGIRELFYFQVDNPLVDVCSAEFLGYHLLADSELTTQVVRKQDSLERVGNVVEVDGRLRVIEYSDLPDEAARRREPDGSLSIWAGSIAVHTFDAAFLDRAKDRADALPFHVAHKKVACIDADGRPVEPDNPNAVKFERFIFDLMPSARNAVVVEVKPAQGFAPLKNAPGADSDTPEMVRAMMIAQHRDWLRQAGAEVAEGVAVEISPLFALDPEQLAEKIKPPTRITQDRYLG